jgi:SAM-dependent methyltransferase
VFRTLYRQTNFPILQNRVYDTSEEAKKCPIGDIEIVEDLETGLVHNSAFQPELMVYDSQYNNEQALSQYFRRHLEQVADIVESQLGKENLVEVGCGKGFFLEALLARNLDVTGFDPAYDGKNERIIKKYFEPGIMRPAAGLILRHVLEHIQHPVDFLHQLKQANRNKGLIYIEVPCFEWICQKRAWFDIFYEHVNYFRIDDFRRIFSDIISAGRLFNGQYIYVVARLESLQKTVLNDGDQILFPSDFDKALKAEIHNHPCAIWGGASKGVIFSLLKSRHNQNFDFAIDINPAKQGKYLPLTALEVYSPEKAMQLLPAGSAVYVMNSNYLDEIRQMTQGKFNLIGIDHE